MYGLHKLQMIIGGLFGKGISAKSKRVQRQLHNSQRLIVSRLARGNVSIQNGRYLTREDLEAERAQREKYYREHPA
ncbi:hypothetical protein [Kordiimonas pumila]|uniref:Uncharacterized protein n=1 Tax=Kordiimonas pumila TaxID=2161677 RepID=A0ABV7D817_9PROT|nr:hypothetical protein [Kordiimonas pumila]